MKRLEKGWSQRELGEAIGVDRSYIAQIEGGSRKWPEKHISALSTALGLPESEFTYARMKDVFPGAKEERREDGSMSLKIEHGPTDLNPHQEMGFLMDKIQELPLSFARQYLALTHAILSELLENTVKSVKAGEGDESFEDLEPLINQARSLEEEMKKRMEKYPFDVSISRPEEHLIKSSIKNKEEIDKD